MGYQHIPNLYNDQRILAFREVYAMEKIHGTSAGLHFRAGEPIRFHSGGCEHGRFVMIFDADRLGAGYAEVGHADLDIYGEAYGGKIQGMSGTYGVELRFIAFEVRIGKNWLAVPQAEEVVGKLGLEFVPYERVAADLPVLNLHRDMPSRVAERRLGPGGIGKPSEGIVLRPPFEVTLNNGDRLIAKHKRAEFCETASKREVDPGRAVVLAEADAIAFEFVTPMRMEHVLDKLFPGAVRPDMSATPDVIRAVIEDVAREGAGEYEDSKEARRAMGSRAAELFKALVSDLTWRVG